MAEIMQKTGKFSLILEKLPGIFLATNIFLVDIRYNYKFEIKVKKPSKLKNLRTFYL